MGIAIVIIWMVSKVSNREVQTTNRNITQIENLKHKMLKNVKINFGINVKNTKQMLIILI